MGDQSFTGVGALPDIGTIGTIQSGITVSVEAAVATIGSIQSPVGVGGGTIGVAGGTIGTIQSPVADQIGQQSLQTNILTNVTVSSLRAATLLAGTLQDLVVDAVFGTVVVGSILVAVVGVEPQSNLQTSTIVASPWFAGTLQTGARIQAVGPLGMLVAVQAQPASGGTINQGTILNVYVTAEQSTTQ